MSTEPIASLVRDGRAKNQRVSRDHTAKSVVPPSHLEDRFSDARRVHVQV